MELPQQVLLLLRSNPYSLQLMNEEEHRDWGIFQTMSVGRLTEVVDLRGSGR